jgi:two-component system response regulator YesN
MVVEDHVAVHSLLREWLEIVFPGCQVLEAAHAEQAITLAAANLPHLILMDVGLPKINGIEAARRIKLILPEILIVMLTIHEDDAYRLDSLAVGASAYVPKQKMPYLLLPTLTALLPAHLSNC